MGETDIAFLKFMAVWFVVLGLEMLAYYVADRRAQR